jgi:hypothetical protein
MVKLNTKTQSDNNLNTKRDYVRTTPALTVLVTNNKKMYLWTWEKKVPFFGDEIQQSCLR